MSAADEACFGDILDQMLMRIKMPNEDFQKSLMNNMGNPTRLPLIQKARQDNEECKFDVIQLPDHLKDLFKGDSSKKC